jgi:iron complex transport system substrate-binding protein
MGPFPQLSPEFVLRAQPAGGDGRGPRLAEMPQRPGWRHCARCSRARCGFAPAPYDALVRAGPRLAEAAEAMADCLPLERKVAP